MSEPEHTVELKVWFTAALHSDTFALRVCRSSWAGNDAVLEVSVRGKIVTVTGANAEIMGRVVYEYASGLLGRGFITRVQMTGGPS